MSVKPPVNPPADPPTNPLEPQVYPLLWSDDVGAVLDWATTSLGLKESWRATSDAGVVEHGELHWHDGKISISWKRDQYLAMGPSGIAIGVADASEVDRMYALATGANAEIQMPLTDSRVAYSFTALDPDGNQWWVHVENGFLDQFRT